MSAPLFDRGGAVPTDPVERLRGIATRMRHLSRTVRAARDPDARYTGEDPTGMVTVTMDGSGQLVSLDRCLAELSWTAVPSASRPAPAAAELDELLQAVARH